MKAASRQFRPALIPATWAETLDLSKISAYVELTKPRVNLMVVLTAAAGFYMASAGGVDLLLLWHTVLGTALVAGGSAALNQFLEHELDARMARTARRPIPSGRLTPRAALLFGVILTLLGSAYLVIAVNLLTMLLGLATAFLYLSVYTPLKTRTPLCTTVGAFPGAIPPLMGWAGAANNLDLGAAGLFLILLLWQFPHFLAISWAYKRDYQQGGFSMLSSVDPAGRRTGIRILLYSLILVIISFAPSASGLTGYLYMTGAGILGVGLLLVGIKAAWLRSVPAARSLSLATIVYLPALLLLMVLDKA
jgi:heme o synthase